MAFTTNFSPTNPSGLGGLPQGGAITLNGAWPGQPGGVSANGQQMPNMRRPLPPGQSSMTGRSMGPGIRNSPFGAFGAFNPQAHQFTKQLFGL